MPEITLDELIGYGADSGKTPLETAVAVRQWQADVSSEGLEVSETPEDWWRGAQALDQDVTNALSGLRIAEQQRILTTGIPDETERGEFISALEANSFDPERLGNPEWQKIATDLASLPTEPFAPPQHQSGQIGTETTKLADYSLREKEDKSGFQVAVRPVFERPEGDIALPPTWASDATGDAAGIPRPTRPAKSIVVDLPSISELTQEADDLVGKYTAEVADARTKLAQGGGVAEGYDRLYGQKLEAAEKNLAEAKNYRSLFQRRDKSAALHESVYRKIRTNEEFLEQVPNDYVEQFTTRFVIQAARGVYQAVGKVTGDQEMLSAETAAALDRAAPGALRDRLEAGDSASIPDMITSGLSSMATLFGPGIAVRAGGAALAAGTRFLPTAVRGTAQGAIAAEALAGSNVASRAGWASMYTAEFGANAAAAEQEAASIEQTDPERAQRIRDLSFFSSALKAGVALGAERIWGDEVAALAGRGLSAGQIATLPFKEYAEEAATAIGGNYVNLITGQEAEDPHEAGVGGFFGSAPFVGMTIAQRFANRRGRPYRPEQVAADTAAATGDYEAARDIQTAAAFAGAPATTTATTAPVTTDVQPTETTSAASEGVAVTPLEEPVTEATPGIVTEIGDELDDPDLSVGERRRQELENIRLDTGAPSEGVVTPPPAPAPPAARTPITDERIEQSMERVRQQHGINMRRVAAPSKALATLAEQVEKVTGQRALFVDADAGVGGLHNPGDGFFFVNVNARQPGRKLLAHEMIHGIEHLPEYQAMKNKILSSRQESYKAYARDLRINKRYAEDKIESEFIADIVGENYSSRRFWSELAGENPGAFRRIGDSILDLLDKLIAQFRETGREAASPHMTEIRAARDAIRSAILAARPQQEAPTFSLGRAKPIDPSAPVRQLGNSTIAGPTTFSIEAFHGTPHDIRERMSLDEIGTGEGAQAFGYGLYFAEDRKVAEFYRDKLSKGGVDTRNGNLYTLALDVDPDELIDWDMPLSEQTAVYEKLRRTDWWQYAEDQMERLPHNPTGSDLYNYLTEDADPAEASETLRSIGIPGIRYLDGGSRRAGEGSYNYVIFDDNLIRITHRNGEPVDIEDVPAEPQQTAPEGETQMSRESPDTRFSLEDYNDAILGDNRNDNLQQLITGTDPEERRNVVNDWLERNPQFREVMQGVVNGEAGENGYNVRAFHGTDAPEFTEWRTEREAEDGKTADPNAFIGAHFSKNRRTAERFANELYDASNGRVMEVFLRLSNPLQIGRGDDPGLLAELEQAYNKAFSERNREQSSYDRSRPPLSMEELEARVARYEETGDDAVLLGEEPTLPESLIAAKDAETKARGALQNAKEGNRPVTEREILEFAGYDYDKVFARWENNPRGAARSVGRKIREKLIAEGFDGVVYRNSYSAEVGEGASDALRVSYIALNPEQIKSADPVTFDDNGRIIPPNERFQEDSPDIRFSLEEVDERFRDAYDMNEADVAQIIIDVQARRKGLTKLFHASRDSGWSVPHTPVFTSDDFVVAESYNPQAGMPRNAQRARMRQDHVRGGAISGIYHLYVDTSGFVEIDAKGAKWNAVPYKGKKWHTDNIVEMLEDAPGVIFRNIIDRGGFVDETEQSPLEPHDVYVINDGTRMSSADPFTFDDNGQVIPPSQRFQPVNDLRFSMEDVVDIDGPRELTPEQEASPFAVFVLVPTEGGFAATTRAADRGEEDRQGLPGGKVDPGEDPKAAAQREASEEGWSVDRVGDIVASRIVEGQPVVWYRGYGATALTDYKEKSRGIRPISLPADILADSGYGNDFIRPFSGVEQPVEPEGVSAEDTPEETDETAFSREAKKKKKPRKKKETVDRDRFVQRFGGVTTFERDTVYAKDVQAAAGQFVPGEITRTSAGEAYTILKEMTQRTPAFGNRINRMVRSQFADRLAGLNPSDAEVETGALRAFVEVAIIGNVVELAAKYYTRGGVRNRQTAAKLLANATHASRQPHLNNADTTTAGRLLRFSQLTRGGQVANILHDINNVLFQAAENKTGVPREVLEKLDKVPASRKRGVARQAAMSATPEGQKMQSRREKVKGKIRSMAAWIRSKLPEFSQEEPTPGEQAREEIDRMIADLENDWSNVDEVIERIDELVDTLSAADREEALGRLSEIVRAADEVAEAEKPETGSAERLDRIAQRFITRTLVEDRPRTESTDWKNFRTLRNQVAGLRMTAEEAADVFEQLGGSPDYRPRLVEALEAYRDQEMARRFALQEERRNPNRFDKPVEEMTDAERLAASRDLMKRVGQAVAEQEAQEQAGRDMQARIEELLEENARTESDRLIATVGQEVARAEDFQRRVTEIVEEQDTAARKEASDALIEEIGQDVARAEDFQRRLQEIADRADTDAREQESKALIKSVGEDIARAEDFQRRVKEIAEKKSEAARKKASKQLVKDIGEEVAQAEDFQRRLRELAEKNATKEQKDEARRLKSEIGKAAKMFGTLGPKKATARRIPIAKEIENAIMENPEWDISNSADRQKILEDVLRSRGISETNIPAAAKAATNMFEIAMEKMLRENARRILQSIDRGQITDELLHKAIRLNVLDPSKSIVESLAAAKGYDGLTDRELLKIHEWTEKARNAENTQVRIGLLNRAMRVIYQANGIPPRFRDVISSSIRASMYSGLSTLFTNSLGPVNSVVRMIRELSSDLTTNSPLKVVRILKSHSVALGRAVRDAQRSFRVAMRTDATKSMQISDERMKKIESDVQIDALVRLWDRSIDILKDKNVSPAKKARTVIPLIFSTGRAVWKMLGALDSFYISLTESYLSSVHLARNQVEPFSDLMSDFYALRGAETAAARYAVDRLGLSPSEAAAEAQTRIYGMYYDFLRGKIRQDPKAITDMAHREAVHMSGNHAVLQGFPAVAGQYIIEGSDFFLRGAAPVVTGPVRIISQVADMLMWYAPGVGHYRWLSERRKRARALAEGKPVTEYIQFPLSALTDEQLNMRRNEANFGLIVSSVMYAFLKMQPEKDEDKWFWITTSYPTAYSEKQDWKKNGWSEYTIYVGSGDDRMSFKYTRGVGEFMTAPFIFAENAARYKRGEISAGAAFRYTLADLIGVGVPSIKNLSDDVITLSASGGSVDERVMDDMAYRVSSVLQPYAAMTRSIQKMNDEHINRRALGFQWSRMFPVAAFFRDKSNDIILVNSLNEPIRYDHGLFARLHLAGFPFGPTQPQMLPQGETQMVKDMMEMDYPLPPPMRYNEFVETVVEPNPGIVEDNGVDSPEKLWSVYNATRAEAFKRIYARDKRPGETAHDRRKIYQIVEQEDKEAYKKRLANWWGEATTAAKKELGAQ